MSRIYGVMIIAFISVPMLAAGSSRAPAYPNAGDLVEVGKTKDACAGANELRFRAKESDVKVPADSSKIVDLPAFTKELYWYCGGTRERCVNDHPFNSIGCERAGNGAIIWTFYNNPDWKPELQEVGRTKDACGGNTVRIAGRTGDVKVGKTAHK